MHLNRRVPYYLGFFDSRPKRGTGARGRRTGFPIVLNSFLATGTLVENRTSELLERGIQWIESRSPGFVESIRCLAGPDFGGTVFVPVEKRMDIGP